jgi:hypothetical protein
MFKYYVFWMLTKLVASSNVPLPKLDDYGNAPSIIVTCDTLNFTIDYDFKYREFSTRDSAMTFITKGRATKNVSNLKLDSILITSNTAK